MLKYTHHRKNDNGTITKTSHRKLEFSIDINMLTICLIDELGLNKYSELKDINQQELQAIKARDIEKAVLRQLRDRGECYFDFYEDLPSEPFIEIVQNRIKELFPQLV